jgi:hypothetical protein
MPITHTKVSTVADGSTTEHIRPSDWNAAHTIAGTVTLSSGVASSAPLVFTGGTNLTVASSGAVEFDGKVFYATAASSARQAVRTEQFAVVLASRTLQATTVAQYIFNGTTTGALTLAGNTLYAYEVQLGVTGLSTASKQLGWNIGGTASISNGWHYLRSKLGSALSVIAAENALMVNVTGTTGFTAATTLATCCLIGSGYLMTDTSGTIIPQIHITAANSTPAAIDKAYFRIWPMGSTAQATLGQWS